MIAAAQVQPMAAASHVRCLRIQVRSPRVRVWPRPVPRRITCHLRVVLHLTAQNRAGSRDGSADADPARFYPPPGCRIATA
jgi:hypothetical protein